MPISVLARRSTTFEERAPAFFLLGEPLLQVRVWLQLPVQNQGPVSSFGIGPDFSWWKTGYTPGFLNLSLMSPPLWLGSCLLTPIVDVDAFLDPTSMPSLLKIPRFTECLLCWVFPKMLDLKIPSDSILHFLLMRLRTQGRSINFTGGIIDRY